MEFFGSIEIGSKKKDEKLSPSFVPPTDTDGAVEVAITNTIGFDFDASYKNTKEQIELYRKAAANSDVDDALDEIINDAIVFDAEETPVDIMFSDDADVSASIKKKISEEFKEVLRLLNFNEIGDDLFRKWYVDGRIFYHVIIDKKAQKDGVAELRYIDPRFIKKVRDVKKEKGPGGVEIVKSVEEYFVYNDPGSKHYVKKEAVKIPKEAVLYVPSGLMDSEGKEVISYLDAAIKPLNQLVALEDSLVIYRISRAPERRVFYIDTGNLPKTKAEQYMKSIINKHKNKMVYDATTGTVKDNRHIMSMLEDIWLPRREGNRGTEVSTLPGATSLGDMDDVLYFVKKLYKALRIPASRIDTEAVFNMGVSAEISRNEIKFSKFIDKLRKKFSRLFRQALKTQLLLKNIITEDDWLDINEAIQFRFNSDSHFTELKENEILRGRLELLATIDQYVGRYYSIEDVHKQVLKRNDDEIKEVNDRIEQEKADGKIKPGEGEGDFDMQDQPGGEPAPTPVKIVEPDNQNDQENK